MAMPKGFKSENGYGTSKLFDGLTYHEIADTMRESGYKMNHSTARNIFLRSMKKIATKVCGLYDIEPTEENIKRISAHPDFQAGIADFMKEL